MTKRLLILLTILLFASSALGMQLFAGSTASGGDYVLKQDLSITYAKELDVGTAGYEYGACDFTASSSYTVKRIELDMRKVGSPAYDLTVHIYSDDGEPNASLGNSASIAASTLQTTFGTITQFDFVTGVALTNAADYWIVVVCSDDSGGGLNHSPWNSDNNNGAVTMRDADGAGSWTTFSNDQQWVKIYAFE